MNLLNALGSTMLPAQQGRNLMQQQKAQQQQQGMGMAMNLLDMKNRNSQFEKNYNMDVQQLAQKAANDERNFNEGVRQFDQNLISRRELEMLSQSAQNSRAQLQAAEGAADRASRERIAQFPYDEMKKYEEAKASRYPYQNAKDAAQTGYISGAQTDLANARTDYISGPQTRNTNAQATYNEARPGFEQYRNETGRMNANTAQDNAATNSRRVDIYGNSVENNIKDDEFDNYMDMVEAGQKSKADLTFYKQRYGKYVSMRTRNNDGSYTNVHTPEEAAKLAEEDVNVVSNYATKQDSPVAREATTRIEQEYKKLYGEPNPLVRGGKSAAMSGAGAAGGGGQKSSPSNLIPYNSNGQPDTSYMLPPY